jgi:hypothetical protein
MRQFPAITGENALPVLQALVDHVRNDQITIIGGPVRIVETQQGRSIIFEPDSNRFIGAFRVSTVGPLRFQIGEGMVNGEVPIVEGRDLAGLKPDGSPHPEGRPSLLVEDPPEGRRSYLCLQVAKEPEQGGGGNDGASLGVLTRAQLAGTDPALTVVHRKELPKDVPFGLDEEGRGLRPIAQLTWDESRSRVDRVRQILHFDQEYRAPRGSDPRPEWRNAG